MMNINAIKYWMESEGLFLDIDALLSIIKYEGIYRDNRVHKVCCNESRFY